jgi:peroxiredoxin
LAFDGSAIFGGPRSKRYALELEDGKVKALHVEPDNTGLDGNIPVPRLSSIDANVFAVSAAEKVLG